MPYDIVDDTRQIAEDACNTLSELRKDLDVYLKNTYFLNLDAVRLQSYLKKLEASAK